MKTTPGLSRRAAVLAALLVPCAYLSAQTAAAPAATDPKEEILTLTPFEVSSSAEEGYAAATTLAGNRLNTQLRDVGAAVTVVTSQFLRDTGATNNQTLLQYAPSSEVGGMQGNFAGTGDGAQLFENTARPNENTRIRGLAAADNTRDFFRTDIPWDSYNTDRVDLQRGPNSILFGQGSPAGIINAGSKGASFKTGGNFEFRVGSYGSVRGSLDFNQVILKDELALRVNALDDAEKFQQEPAFSNDKRIAGALRYEPAFLKKNGMRTILKANFEAGKVDSNNPRELPPVDNITPWFASGAAGVNQTQYIGWGAFDHLSGRPGHGAARGSADFPDPSLSGNSSPWIHNGNFGTIIGRNPVAFFGSGGAPSYWITAVPAELQGHGIGPSGAVDGDIGGFSVAPGYMVGIASTSAWAVNSNQPYSAGGVYKDNVITDPSIFDFYNNLIDGDTKREWQKFHSATLNLTQTFFNDQAGFSLDYNKEHYQTGQVAMLGGNVHLYVDPMRVYDDGTPGVGATAEPFSDGTKNPNVGTPFVSSTGGNNNSYTSDREAKRATAFVTHDFAKDHKNWLGRILGSQTLTGLLAKDEQETDSRVWNRYGYFDQNVYDITQQNAASNTFNQLTPTQIVYLGNSLLGKSATGANIPGVAGNPTIGNGTIRYFNDHWNSNVDPAAVWLNNAYLPGTPRYFSTQSENPANYVGWVNAPLNVTDSEQGNRDKLTTFAGLTKSATSSKALVWQGKLFDNALVGTYGWRNDVSKSWAANRNVSTNSTSQDYKQINFSTYKLPDAYAGRVEVQSRSYSIVAHLMDAPLLKEWTKNLPFEISLSYNKSTNFKPDSSRVDVQGDAIASPSGKTIDKGIIIATRDGKYSLKVNRYVTSIKNATSTNSGAFGYGLGSFMGYNAIWTNVWDYHIGNGFWDNQTPGYFESGPAPRYLFHTAGTEIVTPETQADQLSSVAGMRAFEKEVDAALPNFWKAWGFQNLAYVQSGKPIPNAVNGEVLVPAGFTITEDSVSKGWEIELNAQPTRNWRLTLNASKSEAVRSNIGGEALNKLMNIIIKDMQGPAGQLHYWWGTADVPRAGAALYTQLNQTGVDWASRKLLENTNVPELREWRVNAITNYDFTSGVLNGVNIGGGIRYQSDVSIGYPPTGDPAVPASYGYDLANPYKGPSETNFDAWVGYSRKLSSKVHWHVQLNVRNLFKGDDLVPITVQGPATGLAKGTPAGYRIAPSQTFTLTNTFEF
jgi:outer membrane receptor protein involved in Fe transport